MKFVFNFYVPNFILFFLLLVVSVHTIYGQNIQIYVSLDGSSVNVGSKDHPLNSLSQALKKITRPGKYVIFFREGIYQFDQGLFISDKELPANSTLTIQNYKNEKVIFSGDKILPTKFFEKVIDPAILKRLTSSAQQNTYVFDLTKIGITHIDSLHPTGFAHPLLPASMELFEDNIPLPLARWPNTSNIKISDVYSHGPSITGSSNTKVPGSFKFERQLPRNWSSLNKDIFISGYFSYGYMDEDLQVANINNNTVTTAGQSTYGIYGSVPGPANNTQLTELLNLRGFHFYNVLEELDSAGEYYIDRTKNILYVWPLKSISQTIFSVSLLTDPILKISVAGNLTIKGIELRNTRGYALQIDNSKNIRLQNLVISNTGLVGILASKVTNTTVENCLLYNTGAGGININGGDRKNLIPSGNIISNCEFHHYSRIYHNYASAVRLQGVGNVVSGNYIHDNTGMAIYFNGNDHKIINNHFQNVCTSFHDIGAIYTERDPSSTGTIINNNYFDHIQSNVSNWVTAIYFDDGIGGFTVNSNIFISCGSKNGGSFGAIHVNGGGNNYFNNNIFINCALGVSNTLMTDQRWIDLYFRNPRYRKMLTNPGSDIRSEPYTSRYPYLKDFFDSSRIKPRINYINNSVCYNMKKFIQDNSSFKVSNVFMGKLEIVNLQNTPIPFVAKTWENWKTPDFKKIKN